MLLPGANVIKLSNPGNSIVILSLPVIKLYHLVNYHGMAVNYHESLITWADGGKLKEVITVEF